MLSPGPVLLGRVRCAMDGPAKGAAGDVDVPGSPGSSELDARIQRSWDQRQTLYIQSQRWTRRTFLCLAVMVAACLSGALAYVFLSFLFFSVSAGSRWCKLVHLSCLLSYCKQCASWGISCLAVAHCPNTTPASGSTLSDAQLVWRIILFVSNRVKAARPVFGTYGLAISRPGSFEEYLAGFELPTMGSMPWASLLAWIWAPVVFVFDDTCRDCVVSFEHFDGFNRCDPRGTGFVASPFNTSVPHVGPWCCHHIVPRGFDASSNPADGSKRREFNGCAKSSCL